MFFKLILNLYTFFFFLEQLLVNFGQNLINSFCFTKKISLRLFIKQSFVPIFYHMLGSCIVKQRYNPCPIGPMLLNLLEQDSFLLLCPLAFVDLYV